MIEGIEISEEKKQVYLDNDKEDYSTIDFLRAQGNLQEFQRWYLDNGQSILAAVENGWGRAVHPLHIVFGNPKIRILSEFQVIHSPVFLNYSKKDSYGGFQKIVRDLIIREFAKRLEITA